MIFKKKDWKNEELKSFQIALVLENFPSKKIKKNKGKLAKVHFVDLEVLHCMLTCSNFCLT